MQRILIIDDDEILRDLLALHLEIEGYEVIVAADGRAGLDLLQDRGADLVILDLMMPVMDGLRFMRLLGAQPAQPPLLILSAAGHAERERELGSAGADTVIRKPVDPTQLIARVQALLGHDA